MDQSKTSFNQTYGGVTDSQNQFRSSYRSSANPYGGMQQPVVRAGAPQTQVAPGGNVQMNPQTQALQENFNILESKEIQDNLVKASGSNEARKARLQAIM